MAYATVTAVQRAELVRLCRIVANAAQHSREDHGGLSAVTQPVPYNGAYTDIDTLCTALKAAVTVVIP